MKARDLERDLRLQAERTIVTVAQVVEKSKAERTPERFSTRYGYTRWLKNQILPKWGDCPFAELEAPVEIWLKCLPLSPKSRVHIWGVVSRLWKFAMWAKIVPLGQNPMSFVEISGASKRKKKPHSLTVEEFHRFCINWRALSARCPSLRVLRAKNQRNSCPQVERCELVRRHATDLAMNCETTSRRRKDQ